jgi:predicted enzyme related to lactoylglutathione lyase
MPARNTAPIGSPCWVDLWTSDVRGAGTFYGELLGWEAQEPSPEFGGYFMFHRDGVPVAGGMGDMGEMKATNTWKVFLASDDIGATLVSAIDAGAEVISPAADVADLGIQAVMVDPTGAHLGVWQPGTFPGFTVLNEVGAPSWFEIHTGDFDAALEFYRSVFHWEIATVSDSAEFRYATLLDPDGGEPLAGVFDGSSFLAPDAAYWTLYWDVDGTDAAVEKVGALGGSVVQAAEDTPYGRVATVTDPFGATFRLRTPPA